MTNIMDQIMKDMASRKNGSTARQTAPSPACGCRAAGASIRVIVTGRPQGQVARAEGTVRAAPGQRQQYGPQGGFTRTRRISERQRMPPELKNRNTQARIPPQLGKERSPLIKVEKQPVNLMEEIMANLRKR